MKRQAVLYFLKCQHFDLRQERTTTGKTAHNIFQGIPYDCADQLKGSVSLSCTNQFELKFTQIYQDFSASKSHHGNRSMDVCRPDNAVKQTHDSVCISARHTYTILPPDTLRIQEIKLSGGIPPLTESLREQCYWAESCSCNPLSFMV